MFTFIECKMIYFTNLRPFVCKYKITLLSVLKALFAKLFFTELRPFICKYEITVLSFLKPYNQKIIIFSLFPAEPTECLKGAKSLRGLR